MAAKEIPISGFLIVDERHGVVGIEINQFRALLNAIDNQEYPRFLIASGQYTIEVLKAETNMERGGRSYLKPGQMRDIL